MIHNSPCSFHHNSNTRVLERIAAKIEDLEKTQKCNTFWKLCDLIILNRNLPERFHPPYACGEVCNAVVVSKKDFQVSERTDTVGKGRKLVKPTCKFLQILQLTDVLWQYIQLAPGHMKFFETRKSTQSLWQGREPV